VQNSTKGRTRSCADDERGTRFSGSVPGKSSVRKMSRRPEFLVSRLKAVFNAVDPNYWKRRNRKELQNGNGHSNRKCRGYIATLPKWVI